ncbi:hypothetical protein ABNQ39_00025 (plasmid) [Azospirillum sp. A26]|uniref:hypothetical protein n=1 Tax=Azospirillum sp. A26 TaxID=3160607 RepID=UPI003670574E
MTPETRAILCATPASRSGQAARASTIADAAGQDIASTQVALNTLVGMGLVDQQRVPRDLLFSRTEKGDRVAREGGR